MYASASISISIRGSIKRGTSIIAVAGSVAAKNSPCARAAERPVYVLQRLHRLLERIADADDLPIGASRRGAGSAADCLTPPQS